MKRITGAHVNFAEFCRIVEEKTENMLAKNQKHNGLSLWICNLAKAISENDPTLSEYGAKLLAKATYRGVKNG